MDRQAIEKLVKAVLMEQMAGDTAKKVDPSGVLSISLPKLEVTEQDRLATGNPNDSVYCKDLVTLQESPRLGCGLMVMKDTTFDWHLDYDEIDYVIEGTLTVLVDGRKTIAHRGEIIFIPKNSTIQFSVTGDARFLYVTYPADWNN